MAKRYSVYHKKDEMPLIIFASAKDCAREMGISANSFYRYICRVRKKQFVSRKWIICEDAKNVQEIKEMIV